MKLLIALLCLTLLVPEPPLAVDAYAVQQHENEATLTVVLFLDSPALFNVHVSLPPGWAGASDWTGVVSGTQVLTYHLTANSAPPGLGTIVVSAADDRGNRAGDHAWVRAPGEVARPAQRPGRTWLALVRR